MAEQTARRAVRRPKPANLAVDTRLRQEVERRFGEPWFPQQIAARLVRDYPHDPEMRVSHETTTLVERTSHYVVLLHLRTAGAPVGAPRNADTDVLELARSRTTSIEFAVFKRQVVSYLPAGDRPRYDSPDAWDTMVLEVLDALDEGLA